MTHPPLNRSHAWWLAVRPRTLPAALAPVLVGVAIGRLQAPEAWSRTPGRVLFGAMLCAAGALWLQIGTNLVNDAADAARGADTADRTGPTRAVASGLLRARAVWRAAALAFGLATLCGVGLTLLAGWPIVVIGCCSIAAGYAYTAGPAPLAYNALGDLFVMIFFGWVAVGGTAFVVSGTFGLDAIRAALVPGALVTAILVVNNLRDEAGDRRAGKRTLVVRWGHRFGCIEYGALLALAYGVPLYLALQANQPRLLLALVSLPWGVWLLRRAVTTTGSALNQVLAGTAQLAAAHSALFALSLWWCAR